MQIGSDAVTSTSSDSEEAHLATLCHLLRLRASQSPERTAYSYLADEGDWSHLTDRQLAASSMRVAEQLRKSTEPGDRVILSFPPGLEFIVGFFGTLLAGCIAVPATYPRPRRPEARLTQILSDSAAKVGLSTGRAIGWLEEQVENDIEWIDIPARGVFPDEDATGSIDGDSWNGFHLPSAEDTALLQYTSGSTAEPKGVMVTHGNLTHNLDLIGQGFQRNSERWDGSERVGVFWLPAYHDMGLIGTILMPFYAQWRSVLMPPALFLRRPELWLQTISDLRAALTGAPNFAFDRCVEKVDGSTANQLDLSCLKLIFCGAEPIRVQTIERFANRFQSSGLAHDVWYPCYGMAESTLMASGPAGAGPLRYACLDSVSLRENRIDIIEKKQVAPSEGLPTGESNGEPVASRELTCVVNCGQAHNGQDLVIVDPQSRMPCSDRTVGEIWIQGESVAHGYWKRPEETAMTFQAELASEPGKQWMRTGDLGFLDDGELYVTGREKDVLIIRGQNFYPQDIELAVSTAHPALPADSSAAFALDMEGGEGVVVVQELDRQHRHADFDEIQRRIRQVVAETFELDLSASVLIRQASLPRTTSGKVQRKLCRTLFQSKELAVVSMWERPSSNGNSNGNATSALSTVAELKSKEEIAQSIEHWLLNWIESRCGEAAAGLDRETPLSQSGLDSIAAVEMSIELEKSLDVEITPAMAWDHPTPGQLAEALALAVLEKRQQSAN